jgi:hypothetical protein
MKNELKSLNNERALLGGNSSIITNKTFEL